jgi:hypothetical protein
MPLRDFVNVRHIESATPSGYSNETSNAIKPMPLFSLIKRKGPVRIAAADFTKRRWTSIMFGV